MPGAPSPAARSTGMHSKRTRVYVAAYPAGGAVPATGPLTTAMAIPDVISAHVPGPVLGETKITHLMSPDGYHEYVPGFGDGDTFTVKSNSSDAALAVWGPLTPFPTNAGPDYGRLLWEVVYPDRTAVRFIGFLKGLPVDVPDDDRITLEASIRVSGKPVLIAAAAYSDPAAFGAVSVPAAPGP